VSLISSVSGKSTKIEQNMFLASSANLTIDIVHGTTTSQDSQFKYALEFATEHDTYIHYHETYRRMPVAFTGLKTFIDWGDTESYPGRGTAYNFIDLTGGNPITSTTTSTSTTSTSTTSTTTIDPGQWFVGISGSANKPGGDSFNFNWTAPTNAVGSTSGYFVVEPGTQTAFSGSAIFPSALGADNNLPITNTSGSISIPTTAITSGPTQKFQIIITGSTIGATVQARSGTVYISGPWATGYANVALTKTKTTSGYNFFKSGRVGVIQGDGTGGTDPADWTVFHFDIGGHGDYDGKVDELSYFGGESTHSGGNGGQSSIRHGAVWGLNSTRGWQLLYQLPLGSSSPNTFNHKIGNWFDAGGTVTTGQGKRIEYDNMAITDIGFSAHTSAFAWTNSSGFVNDTPILAIPGLVEFAKFTTSGYSSCLTYVQSFGVDENSENS
jgi:hypothetical protein